MGVIIPVNIPPTVRRKIFTITVHHTAGNETSVEQIRRMHKARGWRDIAYHFVCFPDGRIEVGRNPEWKGAGVWGNHDDMLEIVLVGNFVKKEVPMVQWYAATTYVAKLCLQKGIPYWKVYGHKEVTVPGHGTLCPGFDPKQFRIGVAKRLKEMEEGK